MHSIAQKRTFTTNPPLKRTFKKMKSFSIPSLFKSNLIGRIKEARRVQDKLKKDFTPTHLDFGPVEVLLSRHFGFCYGVENAVETAYQIIDENPDKRIFFLNFNSVMYLLTHFTLVFTASAIW